MSFLRNGKSKEKDLLAKKSQFYVQFLGWMETNGLRGVKYTEPVIRELRRRQKRIDRPPKLTIQVSKKELKISQDVEEKKKRNIKKIKFPTIPAQDVTFAVQSMRSHDGRPDDIVACIYLGFMPRTGRYVHAHVYRFDEPQTATTFVRMLNQLTDSNENRIREVERDLAAKGEIENVDTSSGRLGSSDGMSDGPYTGDSAADSAASNSTYSDESPTFGSDDIDPDLQSLADVQAFDSVTEELRQRLNINKGDTAPILLPPADYDTISRARGNFTKHYDERRCLQIGITGNVSQFERDRKVSGESGIDVNSPSTESATLPGSHSDSPSSDPREFVYPPPEAHNPISKRRSGSYKNNSSESPPIPRRSPPIPRRSPPIPRMSPSVSRKENIYVNSPPIGRKAANFSNVYNPRTEQFVRHARQSSQTSDHSANSFRSRGSQEEEVVIFQDGTDRLPAEDFYGPQEPQEPQVEMRRHGPWPLGGNRMDLGKSLPSDLFRRERMSAGPQAAGGMDMYQLRRSQNDVQYSDGFNSPRSGYNSPRTGSGDFQVRRVNSMLR